MNPAAIRLFLTLLWLITGLGFLALDFWSGRVIGVQFGQWRMPFWIPCLIIAAFDFIRWRTARNRVARGPILRGRRAGRHYPESVVNPEFRFDEPTKPPQSQP